MEIKAGHLPAARAGGRRIIQKKDRRQSENSEGTPSDSSDDVASLMLDTDLQAKLEKSYPTQAVKQWHEKPISSQQMKNVKGSHQAAHQHRNGVQQPRKQTH